MRLLLLLVWAAAAGLGGDLKFSDPAGQLQPPPGAAGYPSRDPNLDVLPGFVKPPPGYGEVAFYWWLGDPLTRARIEWQLDQLKGMGVQGLQVNYAHSDRGGVSYGLTYPSTPALFSEAWWDLFGWYLKEARKRGMAVSLSDYTLGPGQGWYFDEILKENPGLHGASLDKAVHDCRGACSWDPPAKALSLTAYRVRDGAIVPGSGLDLRGNAAGGRLAWQVPPGEWRIIAVFAAGEPVSLDPMNPLSGKKVIEKFFQRFEDRNPGESGKGLNFFFSDELNFNVRGWLWNQDFAAEFRKRKGYEVTPELAALFFDTGPRAAKVRLDYSDVMVALSEENYFRPVHEWHVRRGMIFGCDHGGRGRDVTEFGDYFRTQRWMSGPGNDQPNLASEIIKNKVASSIAHLYQRPRTWLEGYHSSGWGTSPAQVADATFRNFAMGHNLLTLHGLYYSTHGGWWEWAPPCNHYHMPYWPHMGEFLRASERLSYLLSQGVHRADVAIVYPVAPMEAGLGGRQSVETAFALGRRLYEHGIDFDFIDFESLARARVEGKQLRVAGEQYRALVLPAMRAVRFSTAEKALEFRRGGGLAIALGALPEASDRVGRDDAELNAMVREAFAGARLETPEQVEDAIQKAFPRDFQLLKGAAKPGSPQVLHRRAGPRDIYFVYGAPKDSECFFRARGKVELWDPWTGRTRPLSVLSQTAEGTRIRMPLEDVEAHVVVFSPGRPQRETDHAAPPVEIIPIEGPWEFELKPVLDNRWGDYRLPAHNGFIGAEARKLLYADEATPNPGWQDPGFDDSQWQRVTYSYGPRFWKLGPLPEDQDPAALEARLARLESVDPSVPVEFGGKRYLWQAYEFSMRWGVEGDPGHEGYHGLKGEVTDDFIALGARENLPTGTRYGRESGGSRYYLWTSIPGTASEVRVSAGGMQPAKVWLSGAVIDVAGAVRLNAGSNPVLVRYDQPGRAHLVFEAGAPAGWRHTYPLSMTWYDKPGVLPFDTRPRVEHPAGWYRFMSPPGLRAMRIVARGRVRAWAGGSELGVAAGTPRADGASEYVARVEAAGAGAVKVAIRIEQERGAYGGAALPEPVALECSGGVIEPGDWSKIDGLASYSGGAWYRKTVRLGTAGGTAILDLGGVVASAEVRVNGRLAGIKVAPPWKVDISKLVKPGANRIEILVYNTLANHYSTIPTRYRGPAVSGLLGPVRVEAGGRSGSNLTLKQARRRR